jgi:glycosyltransferase involved in cell wall biosynthesis
MSDPLVHPPAAVDAVICTRNRGDKIGAAVASVLACDHPSFTLTVVDQSTDELTREAVEKLMADDPRLRYHHSAEPGLSRAYNTAVSITSAPILAFTDDDCLAPADWLSAVEATFEGNADVDLLYGQVLPVERQADDRRLVPWLPIEAPERIGPGTAFRVVGMGANFAARRRLFERIGGFDEILGGGGPLRSSQDYDMAYRTWKGGSTILLTPDVSIQHDGRREEEDWPSLLSAYGIGDGAFYSKHVRCRDPYATWMFARHLTSSYTRHVTKRLLRRRSKKWPYLRGMITGVREGMRFDVDRAARLYVAR